MTVLEENPIEPSSVGSCWLRLSSLQLQPAD